MQKIMTFAIADVIFDAPAIAKRLTDTCTHHSPAYTLCGACQVEGQVHFVLLPLETGEKPTAVVIAPVPDPSPDGLTSTLEERWEGGFNAIATIDVGDGDYLLVCTRTPGGKS